MSIIDQADAIIQRKAKEKENAVMNTVNAAPGYNKGLAAHIGSLPDAFGFSHIKYLFGVGQESLKGKDARGEYFPSINFGDRKAFAHIDPDFLRAGLDLKKDIHSCLLQAYLMSVENGQNVSYMETPFFKHILEPKLKAFNITDFQSWIPTLNTRFYFEEVGITPRLEGYFTQYPMSSKTERVNGFTNRLMARRYVDTSSFSPQTQSTGEFFLDAQDLAVHVELMEDLIQDANPAIFDAVRKNVLLGIQRAVESAILDGDDTTNGSGGGQGTGHMDSDVAADPGDCRTSWKGLRKRALDNSANGSLYDHAGATVARAMFDKMIAAAGKFANEKDDLLWIVSSSVANALSTGAISEVLTVQNFGGNATIVTGKLPPIYGIDVYTSEFVREDLNANGVYAASSTKTVVHLVKKSRFIYGLRAPARVWAAPSLANSDKLLMSGKIRAAFGGVPQTATEKSSFLAKNVARY